jgi:arginine deiminase
MMHLDTVMTMIDRATFVFYPYIDRHLRSWTVTAGAGEGELRVSQNRSLWDTLAEALAVDEVTVLTTDEDIRAAEREQWDDGNNYLALSPASSSATSATSPPTPCCVSTASKWSPCPAANSAAAGAGHAA